MSTESPRPSSGRSPDEGHPDRLDSWKDLAAYLQRDVSTVQRWEKREGMPVHRHVHEKQGTVYGFRSELDAWWRGRGVRLAQQETDELNRTPATAARKTSGEPDRQVLDPLESPPRPAQVRWAPRLFLSGMVALAFIVVSVFVWPVGRTAKGTSIDIRSLVVLPLDGLSGDPAQEYLADGITDALIAELGKIGSLRVIARSSVMKYKGVPVAASKVARELGVQAVVGGSVLRSGDRIRITANLIDPASDRQIWSDTYERDSRDVLTLQRDVTAAIADQVRARLPASEQRRFEKPRQVNPVVYDAVLRARYLSVRTTDADSRAAIALLDRAIGLDPGFAPAYAELAAAQVSRLAYVTPEETRDLEARSPLPKRPLP
jgi:TolB-like protein